MKRIELSEIEIQWRKKQTDLSFIKVFFFFIALLIY